MGKLTVDECKRIILQGKKQLTAAEQRIAELEGELALREQIVRCRDCKHYYEADNYHPQGNYTSHCCKYFDSYNDEVEPDGFCAWGERE